VTDLKGWDVRASERTDEGRGQAREYKKGRPPVGTAPLSIKDVVMLKT